MKKTFLLCLIGCMLNVPINAQNINFADGNVKDLCVANWDTNGDGELSEAEAAAVTSLGEVFRGNTEITSFDELQYFTGLTSIGGYAFEGCTGLTSVEIPNSVTSIDDFAFDTCSGLTSISIPNSVTSIGGGAFALSGLTTVSIPNSVTSIRGSAFGGCSGLTSVSIPNSVTSIGSAAFANCNALTKVIVSDIAAWCNIAFVYYTSNPLYYAHHLYSDESTEVTDLVIPETVTSIGGYAFYGCSGLTSVSIPNSVTSIGGYAFYGCSGLTSVSIPNSVTSISGYAFYGCSGLTSVSIPNSVTSIYADAFKGCSGLTSIEIPNSVTSIYADAFENCSALNKVIVSDIAAWCNISFGNVYSNPLYYAHHLYSDESTEITELLIPEGVTNIGGNAFYGCSGLTSVSIPNSVTSIGIRAFYGCSSLTSVTVDLASPITINKSCFSNCANATLYVPYGSSAAYEAADYWNEFKEIVEMPAPSPAITFADANVKEICVANWDTNDDGELSEDEAAAVTSLGEVFKGNTEITSFDELQYFTGLTTIDANAFDLCSQLASVVLPPNITTIGCESFKGTALTSVVVPEGVTEIIDRGFADCASMTSVTLPSTLTALRQGAFINCPNLESINLPKSVTTIELAAFRGCSSLNSIDLSEMTVTIAEEAFLGTGLEEVTIPATVTLTGWTNFGWCSNLKMVTVECEGELPSDVFKACAQLETVVLSNASAMRWGSFVDCPKLESVTFLSGNAGDVPYFRNFAGTPDDVMFNVPAGTAESFLKMGYWNLSDLSALPTVKGEFEAEAVAIETMVNGISDGDKTTLANAINEARTAVTNADSYASVIEQIDAIKTAAKTYIAGATLEDNTDITAATVVNADFNNFTIGWKHGWSQSGIYSTGSLINDDVVLDKFIEAWDPTEGNLFSQTIKSLPAGIYRLEADIVTNPWEPAEVEGVNFFAGNRQKEVVTEANLPQHFSVQFSNNLASDCMVGIRIADTHSVNYVAMDNVRLYYVCKTADVPQGVDLVSDADARVYLYNVETGKYLNAGHSYGTHAILDETGLPVRLTKNDETNLWQIYFWEGSRYQQLLFDEGENVWVDYNGQGDKSPWWSITQTGDGSYLIQGEAKAGTEDYLGNNPSRQDMQASYTGVTYTDIISTATVADNIHWRIFTKDDVDLIAAKKSLIATIIRMGESDNVNDDLIASAMSVYEDANASLAAIINAIALLNSQMGMPTEGNSIDMTVLITNPRFENNTTEGWAGANVADGSATPTNYHVHEYFQTNFNMYQTILGVPNGRYLLKWKGFHRPGAKETVAADYAADTDNASAVVYANEVQKTMHNIASDQSDTRLHGTDYETADGFFPDVMEGTRLYFDANHYADQLEVEVTDNVLTIGVKNTENMGERHWVIFSDFELYILENAEQMGNKLAITGGRGVKGGTGKMTVSMANEDEISGIQFRVKLPDGVNFSLTNGKPRITATSRVSGLTVDATKVDDYAQVLIYGIGTSVSGNSGDILSLALEVSEELNADEYELELSNIFLTKSDGLVIKQGSVKGTLTVVEPASGDANRDGDVNVGDIIAIANYILGNPSANFDEEAADFNGDGGKPNVGDIIAIANYILGNNSKARKRVNMELDPQ